MCFSGSKKGSGTMVASLAPSGVSTVTCVPGSVCSTGSHAYAMFFSSRGE